MTLDEGVEAYREETWSWLADSASREVSDEVGLAGLWPAEDEEGVEAGFFV